MFVVTTVDRELNGYRSALWMLDTAGGDARQFTGGRKQDSSPRWSPDGRHIAFLSDRSGTRQLWVMPSDGGECVAGHRRTEPGWGNHLGRRQPDDRVHDEGRAERAEIAHSDVRVVRSLKYKFDGEGFLDGKRRHVHLVDLEGGMSRQVTEGDWDSTQPSLSHG